MARKTVSADNAGDFLRRKPGEPEGFPQWSSAAEQTIVNLCELARVEPPPGPEIGDFLRPAVKFIVGESSEFVRQVGDIEVRLMQIEGRAGDFAEFDLLTADSTFDDRTFTGPTAHSVASNFLHAIRRHWYRKFNFVSEESVAAMDLVILHRAVTSLSLNRLGCERLIARMKRERALLSSLHEPEGQRKERGRSTGAASRAEVKQPQPPDSKIHDDRGNENAERVTDPEFLFVPDGDGYLIHAFGEAGHFRKLKGFGVIHQLIETPGKGVSMLDLIRGFGGSPRLDVQAYHETLDGDAVHNYQARLAQLQTELEEAEADGDHPRAIECRDEMKSIQRHLDASAGRFGQRGLNQECDAWRSAIHANIKRARESLRKAKCPLTAEHFELAITSESGSFFYRPAAAGIAWKIQK
jgi:hypothetical protein